MTRTPLDHTQCFHPTTKAARAKCRREADHAASRIRNLLITNYRIDREAYHALHSAIDNGYDLFAHEALAEAEALRQFEGWLANGRTW